MPRVTCLYIDDSGTRNPDHLAPKIAFRDWFAVGGVLINEEDEGVAISAHERFCKEWGITYPLHSFDIRLMRGRFSWLAKLECKEYNRFMLRLSTLLIGLPVMGHACVIDRPGYDARYREKYGRQTWMLCKTAFSVICERAAKHARNAGRKLRIFPEECDPTADEYIRTYYSSLRTEGMPFSADASAKHAPLGSKELTESLYELKFKKKSSPMAQFADLYLYPMARGGYDENYWPYAKLRERKKLIDDQLREEDIPHLGIKYSCFELVRHLKEAPKDAKSRK